MMQSAEQSVSVQSVGIKRCEMELKHFSEPKSHLMRQVADKLGLPIIEMKMVDPDQEERDRIDLERYQAEQEWEEYR